MNSSEFMQMTRDTAMYPGSNEVGNLLYLTLGLVGEAGETANVLKKVVRKGNPLTYSVGLAYDNEGGQEFVSIVDEAALKNQARDRMIDELGDVLWYAYRIIDELGSTPENVMRATAIKLQSRKDRHGSTVRP